MDKNDLITQYNYDSFVPEKFQPWMRFDQSPPAGDQGPDFPIWDLDERQTRLSQVWAENLFTIVEFGSFT